MIIFDLFSEAIGCVFYGLLSAVVLMAVLYGLLKLLSEGIVKSPQFYIAGVILFPLLAFQFALLIGAVQVRGQADVVEMVVNQIVEGMSGTLGHNDSQQLMDSLAEQMPLLGVFIDTADFSGETYDTIGASAASTMREYLGWYAFRRLMWILGSAFVACLIAMMYDKGPGKGSDRRSSRSREASARSARDERRPRRRR